MPILLAAEMHHWSVPVQSSFPPYRLRYQDFVLLDSRMMILSGPSMARPLTPSLVEPISAAIIIHGAVKLRPQVMYL